MTPTPNTEESRMERVLFMIDGEINNTEESIEVFNSPGSFQDPMTDAEKEKELIELREYAKELHKAKKILSSESPPQPERKSAEEIKKTIHDLIWKHLGDIRQCTPVNAIPLIENAMKEFASQFSSNETQERKK